MDNTKLDHSSGALDQQDNNLGGFHQLSKVLPLWEQVESFDAMLKGITDVKGHTYSRLVTSPTGREVNIIDPYTKEERNMLMFASNNYLGFANHPLVGMKN